MVGPTNKVSLSDTPDEDLPDEASPSHREKLVQHVPYRDTLS